MSVLLLLLACTGPGADSAAGTPGDSGGDDTGGLDRIRSRLMGMSPLGAIPADPTNAVADDPDAAWLGRWLYFDTRLSGSGEHACATCHDPALGFGDGLSFSVAAGTTSRHAPTVLDTAWNEWFFWDGRADSHWSQALKPLEADNEQDTTRLAVVHLIHDDAELRAGYEAVFGPLPDLSDLERFPASGRPVSGRPTDPDDIAWSGMTADDQDTVNRVYSNVGKAIAAYERLLVRTDAPFDTYVEGLIEDDADKQAAISEDAAAGARLFAGEGNCFFCHVGSNLSNGEFHNIGLAWVPGLDPDDLGRYDGITDLLADPFNGIGAYSDAPEQAEDKLLYLTQGPEQIGQFKVPTLRNVALHPPYMHGGQKADLTEVVTFYSELPEEPSWGHREDLMVELDWSDEQIAQVVAFLESLTGETFDETLNGPPDSPIPPGAR